MLKKINLLLGTIASFCGIYAFCYIYCLETIDKLSPSTILLLLVVLLLCLVILIEFSYPFNKNINLKPKFGVLWDENKEPYCPACKTLLSQSVSEFFKNVQLECIKCEESLSLINNDKEISLEEAKSLLGKT
ncbi:MAG: hypothetical protein ACE5GU_09065 [Candidatus Scalinduaceae bacterium]